MKLTLDQSPRRGKPAMLILDENWDCKGEVNPYHPDRDRFACLILAAPQLLAACQMETAFRDWMSGRMTESDFAELIASHGWKEPQVECDFIDDFRQNAVAAALGSPTPTDKP